MLFFNLFNKSEKPPQVQTGKSVQPTADTANLAPTATEPSLSQTPHTPQANPLMLALEPRMMFDAAALVTMDMVDDQLIEQGLGQSESLSAQDALTDVEAKDFGALFLSPTATGELEQQNLILIDSQVADPDQLLQAFGDRDNVYILDSNHDGIEQISDILSGHDNLASVHVLSHGSSGELQLGSSLLDSDTLASRSDEIAGWQNALSEDADLMIYGCSVAEGEDGAAFVQALGRVTQTDVAASDDLTGERGDWQLEVRHGLIDSQSELVLSHIEEVLEAEEITLGVPTEDTNSALSLNEGATGTVATANLQYSDGGTATSAIIYTVDAIPTNGELKKSGTALANSETFTQEDVDNDLITYVHDGGETTSDSFTFTTAVGGDSATQSTFDFTVSAVNDDPAIASLPTDITVTEDVASDVDLSAASLTDADSSSSDITLTIAAGSGALAASTGGGVTIGGSGTSTLTLTGAVSDVDTYLNTASNIQYTGTSNTNGGDADTLTLTVNDGGNTGSGGGADVSLGTVNVDITAVNDLPTGADKTVTTDEDTDYTLTAADFGFSDTADSDSLTHVKITTLETAGALKLSGSDVALNDEVAVADINAGNLVFTPVADANGSSYDSFGFKVKDGTAYSSAENTITVDVTAVNDLPTAADNSVTTNEDTDYTFAASDFGFDDTADSGSLTSIKITSLETVGALKLSGTDVTANQVIAAADITNLTFTPVANANGSSYDAFDFSVNDGTADSAASYTMTIDVTAVNDLPTGADKTVTTDEDTDYTLTAADFGFSDTADSDSLTHVKITTLETAGALKLSGTDVALNDEIAVADINAGNLVFTPVADANGSSYDSFGFKVKDGTAYSSAENTITVDVTAVNDLPTAADNSVTTDEDTDYTFAASDFGFDDTADSGSLTSIKITSLETVGALKLSGTDVTANHVIVAADITNITFTPVANAHGSSYDAVDFSVNDGTADSAPSYTMTIHCHTVNDLPTGADKTVTTDEDTDYTLTAADFGFSDTADGDSLTHVKVTTLETVGALKLSGTDVALNDEIAVADINAGNLLFTPVANANGNAYDSFGFKVKDGTAYSSAENTITIDVTAVNDAPTLDTNTGITVDEGATITISDSELAVSDLEQAAANITYTVTAIPTNGELKLSGTALADNETFTQDDIDNSRITYVHDDSQTTSDSFSFTVSDGDGGSISSTNFALTVTPINDAPTLDNSGTVTFTGIDEDETSSAGDLVSSLLSGLVTEIDTDSNHNGSGMAITAVDDTNGEWQYSDDNGSSWTGLTTANGAAIAADSAFLLDSSDTIRFVPDGDYFGDVSISFKAWDQSAGSVGDSQVDASTGGTTTAFSSAVEDATITITPINDAPVLDNSGDVTLTTIDEDDSSSAGDTISDLIAGLVTETDTNAAHNGTGIAITRVDDANGEWQYSTDGGTNWTGLTTANGEALTTSSAVLLDATHTLRFVPDGDYNGSATLDFLAWDKSSGSDEDTAVDVTTTGTTTAFSVASEAGTITIDPVNDAPTLDNSGTVSFTAIDEDDFTSDGDTISTLFSALVTEIDTFAAHSGSGIAITSVDDTNGSWEYSTDGGTNWTSITTANGMAVSDTKAFLLESTNKLRFVPDADFNGTADITVRSWDVSAGADEDSQVDTSTNGDTTAFSTATESATITVNPVNDAPTLDNSTDLTLTVIDEDPSSNTGTTVADLIDGLVTEIDTYGPHSGSGIAVTAYDDTLGEWEFSSDGGSSWTSLGSWNGSTLANDSAVLLNSTDRLRFNPAEHQNSDYGAATLTFRAWDHSTGTVNQNTVSTNNNGTTYAFSSDAETVTQSITAINDTPEVTIVADSGTTDFTGSNYTVTPDEGTNQVFELDGSVTTDIQLQFVDVDIEDNPLTVSMTVSNGTLTMDDVTGLTFIDGTANGDATLSFTGTLAEINTALDRAAGLTYTPSDLDNDVPDDLELTFNDQGEVGVGNATDITARIDIDTVPINDAPLLNASGNIPRDLTTYPGGYTVESLISTMTEVDTVDQHIQRGMAVIGVSDGFGQWMVAPSTGNLDWQSLTSMNGEAISETSAVLLESTAVIRFVPIDGLEYDEQVTLTIRGWDQTSGSNYDTQVDASVSGDTTAFSVETITYDAINDRPALSVNGVDLDDPDNSWSETPEEEVDVTFNAANGNLIVISDSDLQSTDDMQIDLEVTYGTLELLDDAGGLDYIVESDTYIRARGTITEMNTALANGLVYHATENNDLADALKVTLNDLGGTGGDDGTGSYNGDDTEYTIGIDVIAINDAPTISDMPASVDIDEDAPLTFDGEGSNPGPIVITEVDSGDKTVVATIESSSGGSFALGSALGLTVFQGGFDTDSLGVAGTVDEVNAAFATLIYTPPADVNGNAADTITLTVNDEGSWGIGDGVDVVTTTTVNITAQEDDPTAQDFNLRLSELTESTSTGITVDLDATPDSDSNAMLADIALDDLIDGAAIGDVDAGAVLDLKVWNSSSESWDDASATTATGGTLSVSADNAITYLPGDGYNGLDSFQYQVEDETGRTAEATVTVMVENIENDTPTATDDSATIDEDDPVTLDVLANDTGLDGISVTEDYGRQVLLTSDPVDSDGVVQGSAVVNADGSISYIPAADFVGDISFTYQVQERDSSGQGSGTASEATVTITVVGVNDAPVVSVANSSLSVTEDQSLAIDGLTISDVDEIGQSGTRSMQVTLTTSQGMLTIGESSHILITSGTNGSSDSLEFYGTIENVNAALASLSYQGQANADGSDTLTVTVDDLGNSQGVENADRDLSTRLSGTATIDIELVGQDDPPSAAEAVTVPVTAGEAHSFDPLALEADSSTGQLAYSYVDSVEGDSVSIGSFSWPEHGSLILEDGQFTYTADDDYVGQDSFTYSVVDSAGNSAADTTTVTLDVSAGNRAPELDPQTLQVDPDSSVTFDLLDTVYTSFAAVDPEGNPMFVVDFDNVTDLGATISLQSPVSGTMTYTAPSGVSYGEDLVRAEISDSKGASRWVEIPVYVGEITSLPPVAMDDSVSMTEGDDALAIDVLDNDQDLQNSDNSALSVAAFDAVSSEGGSVSLTSDGQLQYTPAENFSGEDSFSYAVQDGSGNVSTMATVTVSVDEVNSAPEAADDLLSTPEDVAITSNLLDNDSDPLDTMYGEELSLRVIDVVQPAHGVVVFDESGNFTYTPELDFNGEESFQYTIADKGGLTSTATVTVIVNAVADDPRAIDDTATVREDSSVIIDVLDNDSDPENPDSLFLAELGEASHGQTYVDADGMVEYIPDANYNGSDSFTYSVMDGYGGISSATVYVTVEAEQDAPTVNDDEVIAQEDTSRLIDVEQLLLANDSDSDGSAELELVSFTQPLHGTLVDNNDGTLSYTPDSDYNGSDSFDYVAEVPDGLRESGTVTMDVLAINDAPVITAPASYSEVDEDTAVTLTGLSFSDSDRTEGDDLFTLTISADRGEVTLLSTAAVTLLSASESGQSVQVQGDYSAINSVLDSVQYQADQDYYGWGELTISIDDLGNGGADSSEAQVSSATHYINVLPVGDLPVVSDATYRGGVEDASSVGLIYDTFAEAFDTVESTDGLAQIKITELPDAMLGVMKLDGSTLTVDSTVTQTQLEAGLLTFAPVAELNGEITFKWQGSHESGNDALWPDSDANFTLTLDAVNDAPELTVTSSSFSTAEDQAVEISGLAVSDIDAGELSLTLSVASGTVTITDSSAATVEGNGSSSVVLSGTSSQINTALDGVSYQGNSYYSGSDQLDLLLSDGGNGSEISGSDVLEVSESIAITITPVINAPEVVFDSLDLDEDGSITFSESELLANDSNIEDPSAGLTITSMGLPSQGALESMGSGAYRYTPDANANGSDSFTYTVDDGNGGTAMGSVTVTINAQNDAPVLDLTGVPALELENGATIALAGISLDDVDGDEVDGATLQLTIQSSAADSAITLTGASSSLVLSGEGSDRVIVTGTLSDLKAAVNYLSYTAGSSIGSDTLSLSLNDLGNNGDGGALEATGELTVTVSEANVAPIATTDIVVLPANDLDEDSGYTVPDVRSNDSDANSGDTLQVMGFSQAQNSNATVRYLGSGSFTYIPDVESFSGLDWFSYRVGDGNGGFTDSIIYITDDEEHPDLPADGEVILDLSAEAANIEESSEAEQQVVEAADQDQQAEDAKKEQMAKREVTAQQIFAKLAKAEAGEKPQGAQQQAEQAGGLDAQLQAQSSEEGFEQGQADMLALFGNVG
uniref:DUF4347 domain-containing protein n=1 Tax=Magnetococcus massalia (strain MO-1) TaxID=451514 RepID=A0A1S7LEB8_MAGMO|nr:protein of unknown function [Candidatus Magnetococcus massalia]